MGYASYEAGLETIDVHGHEEASYPDICFAYITRSIVFDHQFKKIYVQSIRGPFDQDWVIDTTERLYEHAGFKSRETTPNSAAMRQADPFEAHGTMHQYIDSCVQLTVGETEYCKKVSACQDAIADGQSY